MTNGSFSSCGSTPSRPSSSRVCTSRGLLPRLSGSQSRLLMTLGTQYVFGNDDIRVCPECGKCREGRGSEAGGFKSLCNNRIDHFTLPVGIL